MTASVTGDVAEEPLYSQVGCGLKLYLMAKVWYKVGENRFHLVEHVEKVLRRYLISLKTAYQRLKCAFGAITWRLMYSEEKDPERGICGAEQAESGISRERSIVETGTLCKEGWQSHGFGCTCPV